MQKNKFSKILIYFLLLTVATNAQYIKTGVKLNYINYNITLNNDFININFASTDNLSIVVSEINETSLNILFAPELFLKYDFKNYLFIEASSQYNSTTILYNSTVSNEYLDNNNNIIKKNNSKIIETDLKLIIPSLKLGVRFFKTKLIRPVLLAGISMPIKLDYKIINNTISLSSESFDVLNNTINNSINDRIYLFKIGTEFQFYSVTLGVTYNKNLLKISKESYYDSFSTVEIYFAYNLVNLSTTKKQNE